MAKILVEICCGSADDVFEAKRAGANRVELNSAMFLGGLTPSLGEFKVARRSGMEIMAMVRPREGGFCYTEREFETALADADALLDAGAGGIVFGFLHDDGTVDAGRCRAMLARAGDRESVFHRAIDVVPDWRAALDILCELGVTRVLTSGQEPSVHYGADTVRAMTEYAAGRIEILPGAGILLSNAEEIIERTGCTQIHLAMEKKCRDGSTGANPRIYFGGALYPPEDCYSMADGERIRRLVSLVGL